MARTWGSCDPHLRIIKHGDSVSDHDLESRFTPEAPPVTMKAQIHQLWGFPVMGQAGGPLGTSRMFSPIPKPVGLHLLAHLVMSSPRRGPACTREGQGGGGAGTGQVGAGPADRGAPPPG